MPKTSGGAGPTTIDVDVTPVDQCHRIVICDVDRSPGGQGGGYVDDGVIFLSNPGNYQINFHLKPGGALGNFSWDGDPFWARRAQCPNVAGTPPQITSVGLDPADPRTLMVGANGVQGRSALHFRLNMTDPGGNQVFCDPIIINQ